MKGIGQAGSGNCPADPGSCFPAGSFGLWLQQLLSAAPQAVLLQAGMMTRYIALRLAVVVRLSAAELLLSLPELLPPAPASRPCPSQLLSDGRAMRAGTADAGLTPWPCLAVPGLLTGGRCRRCAALPMA